MAARLTPQQLAYRAVSEREWQLTVQEHFEWRKWKFFHVIPPRGVQHQRLVTCAGFPDVVAMHIERRDFLVAELKRETEHPTAEQLAWLAAYEARGIDAYVWRPSDVDFVKLRAEGPIEGRATE